MRKLSKYEKETIINWNEGENIASIYTFNASLKRRLEDFSRKYPLLCRLEAARPMCWTNPAFLSGWCRRTVKNGWRLQGSTQRNMAFKSYRQKKKLLEMRAIYQKIPGLHPVF